MYGYICELPTIWARWSNVNDFFGVGFAYSIGRFDYRNTVCDTKLTKSGHQMGLIKWILNVLVKSIDFV